MKNRKYAFFRFVSFLLSISFTVTCCMILFLNFLDFTKEQIKAAAPITMGNVILLTAIFCLIDRIRYRQMVDKPVQMISQSIEKAMRGDFSVRIPTIPNVGVFDEYETIAKELNQLFIELNSVETLRTDFIASVSHELKTPMSVIQNYGTILQSPAMKDEKRIEYGKKITEQTRRLSGMVTNILRLNKLENQQVFPDMQHLDLSEHICESILSQESIWEQKNLKIETDLADGIFIMGDPDMLSLVWTNLMSNAIKFTEPGGRITVRVYQSEETAVAEFEDTGCGIDKQAGDKIFQKFYQEDTSHAVHGNGLGLALVKRVIEIHNADISVSSEVKKGTIFKIRFPLLSE